MINKDKSTKAAVEEILKDQLRANAIDRPLH